MRISTSMQFESQVNVLQDQTEQLFTLRRQVTTGRRLVDGTTDPQGYVRAQQLHQQVTDGDAYSTASNQAKSDLQNYDSAFSALGSLLLQARSLAQQGANDTLSADSKSQIAGQVDSLLQQAIQIGNTFSNGRYIFGGSNTNTPPYSAVTDASGKITGISYNGDGRDQSVHLEGGTQIGYTVAGTEAFGARPGDGANFMGALISLRDNVTADNSTAVSQSLNTLDNVQSTILGLRGDVGVRLQHLDNLDQYRTATLNDLQAELASVEDVNVPEAATQLAQEQTSYQAALAVAAQLQNNSLISRLQ